MINDQLKDTAESFKDFCSARGIVFEQAVRRDLLASALGSQLVLFAGPSGTGKSTAARLLAEYFTTPTSIASVDVRPMWVGADGPFGFHSKISSAYEVGPSTEALVQLAKANAVPFLILEEANLSPMEVYVGNVVSQLSGLTANQVRFQLHSHGSDLSTSAGSVPPLVAVGPWPRVMATINVDSTASAPSPKVCGRGLTVLLEPPSFEIAKASAKAIGASAPPPPTAVGGPSIGDPRAAWYAALTAKAETVLFDSLDGLCSALESDLGANYVSPRDVQRALLFMAWYVAIAEHDSDFKDLKRASDDAAELALLHAVLPGLGSGQFGPAAESLRKQATADGLLSQRLDKVLLAGKGLYGVPPDYWASLS